MPKYLAYVILYSVAELYEYALQPEHIASVDPSIYPTSISDTGSLSVSSGSKTGRTPKDKRVVLDETTKDVRIIYMMLADLHSMIFLCRLYGGAT